MKRVAIVTDSTACLPRELARELGIGIVPLTFVFGDASYQDDPNLDIPEFYHRLQQADKSPTTSPASPGRYLEVFKELGQEAQGILCVTVSSRISGMYQSATLAKEMAAEHLPSKDVRIMDSGTAAMAQGFVALAAARAADRGEDMEGVYRAAEEVRARVRLVAVVDTLRYLAKSGRFPRVAAWGASLIGLRPVLVLRQGQVHPVAAVKSTRGGMAKLINLMLREAGDGTLLHVSIMHSNALNQAEELQARILEKTRCAELHVTHFTPVMGVYTGPGVLGLAFYSEG